VNAPLATIVAAPTAFVLPASALESVVPALEQRVRRLEDAIARLQSGSTREAKPAEQIRRERSEPALPTALLLDVGKRLLQPSEPKPVPPTAAAAPEGPANRRWLLAELVAEARAILRMFVDPRYRLSWFGRMVPLVLIAAIATSHWWVLGTSIPLFGTFLEKAVDLVLAFVLFKVLSHEARRYRETSPDLPQKLRL
jgi:hypothetical protein